MVKPSAFDVSEQVMGSSVVFIHWIIYKIILKIMEFNSNGALINFYQARV